MTDPLLLISTKVVDFLCDHCFSVVILNSECSPTARTREVGKGPISIKHGPFGILIFGNQYVSLVFTISVIN